MTCYVVAAPGLSPRNEAAFAAWLPDSTGWWHHVPGIWLVTDPQDELSAAAMRDWLNKADADLSCLVLEVTSGGDWAAVVPTAKLEASNTWLEEHWDNADI